MKYLSYLFLLFACIHAQAQAPGYMGKRFNVGYGIHLSPMILDEAGSGNFKSARYDGFGLNVQHEAFAEFALARKFSIGLSGRFYKTSYFKNSNYSIAPYYGIKAQNFTLYGKLYYRNCVAPWGRYMIFGPTFRHFTATYDSKYQVDPGTGKLDLSKNYGPPTQSFTNFDIVFGTGRTRVIADRITIDYGYTLNIFALFGTVLDIDGANLTKIFSSSDSYGEEIGQTARWRIRGVNRVNVFLRVGYLF